MTGYRNRCKTIPFILCDTLLHIPPLDSDTFFPTFWKPPETLLVPLLRNVAPPRPDSLLQCCLVGKPFPAERFLHGAKEMVVGGCQVWGCGKAGAGWSGSPVMQCCSWCMRWCGGGHCRVAGARPMPISPASSAEWPAVAAPELGHNVVRCLLH